MAVIGVLWVFKATGVYFCAQRGTDCCFFLGKWGSSSSAVESQAEVTCRSACYHQRARVGSALPAWGWHAHPHLGPLPEFTRFPLASLVSFPQGSGPHSLPANLWEWGVQRKVPEPKRLLGLRTGTAHDFVPVGGNAYSLGVQAALLVLPWGSRHSCGPVGARVGLLFWLLACSRPQDCHSYLAGSLR